MALHAVGIISKRNYLNEMSSPIFWRQKKTGLSSIYHIQESTW